MAKAKRTEDADVKVIARAGFKHRGVFVRSGEQIYMTRAEAADMAALYMIDRLPAEKVEDR